MEQTVLTASGLTMRYHSTLALDNLDLTLPQGKIVGLLGPNGSGKTTFIKLAAGLLTPTAGEITICGNKIGTATKAVVSYLPERQIQGVVQGQSGKGSAGSGDVPPCEAVPAG